MQLPNKLYSYKNSTLALVPAVLKELKGGPLPVIDLYKKVRPILNDPTDFISVIVETRNSSGIVGTGSLYVSIIIM